MDKYVVLDLEMCNVVGEAREALGTGKELIQIGAVLLDDKYNVIDHFDTLVKPEYGAIDRQIEELTKISQKDVENAPSAYEALKMLEDWIPDDSILVTWSENDAIQIDDELYYKDLDLPKIYHYIEEYMDCQELFSGKMHTAKKYQLSEALLIANIDYDENIHNAHVDAYNTGLLFKKIQTEEKFTLSPFFMTQDQIFDPFKMKK